MTGKSLRYFSCLDTMRTIHCGYDRLLEALELNPNPVKTVINTISGGSEVSVKIAPLMVTLQSLHAGDSETHRNS